MLNTCVYIYIYILVTNIVVVIMMTITNTIICIIVIVILTTMNIVFVLCYRCPTAAACRPCSRPSPGARPGGSEK